MGRKNVYIVHRKPRCRNEISADEIHAILSAIPGIQILRNTEETFEFRSEREPFTVAKNRLREWCLVQRERFLHDEGGG